MKKFTLAEYGTRFKKDISSTELVECLPLKIQTCENWLSNLKKLQEEATADVAKQQKETLRNTISSLTTEEKEELKKLLNG